ncbi:MAG: hypothetical protein JSU96_05990 [Acidobacteriota bacterium]|nr:MAG: hypothetical protein JSU96_05990 [Acidobacteriota bacterium]
MYQLESNCADLYVSDWTQGVLGTVINGHYDPYINSKVVFPVLMEAVRLPYPRTITPVACSGLPSPNLQQAEQSIRESVRDGGIVLKPVRGSKGRGIFIVEANGDGCLINGEHSDYSDLGRLIERLRDYIATELIHQHDYAAVIYPRTTNTIRILTMWDDDSLSPFVAAAAHRFGTVRSFPVDNFKAGMGGLSSRIAPETGELGPAVTYSEGGSELLWHERHPESGALIRGILVPGWTQLVESVLSAATQLNFAPLIGWDIVVCSEGFSVLEINGGVGLFTHQVHEPLLQNPRVRRFYETRIGS